MCNYVIVDLEMCNVPSGEDHRKYNYSHEIIQIGAARLDDSLEICDTFMSYVSPQFGALDSYVSDLTGIKNADLIGAPSCKDALCEFVSWLPEEVRLVSWSSNDEKQIRKETAAKRLKIPGLNELLDNWIDCQKTFDDIMYSSRNYSLIEALNISSIDYDEHLHDALVDAKNTALLFAKMEREKGTSFKLNPYISIGKSESSGFTPFADLLKDFCVD